MNTGLRFKNIEYYKKSKISNRCSLFLNQITQSHMTLLEIEFILKESLIK